MAVLCDIFRRHNKHIFEYVIKGYNQSMALDYSQKIITLVIIHMNTGKNHF